MIDKIRLKPQTYETARKFAAGYDMYMIEDEWRHMLETKGEMPLKPDGSFVGFVKWYVEEHGPMR
jgi:hypothetical protein